MDEKKKYELIDQYLLGKLNETESANVEKLLQEDASFAQVFEAHQAMQEIFIQDGLQDIRTKLNNIHHEKKTNNKHNSQSKKWIVTGLVIMLLIPLYFLLLNKNGNKTEQVAHESDKSITDSIDQKSPGLENMDSGINTRETKKGAIPVRDKEVDDIRKKSPEKTEIIEKISGQNNQPDKQLNKTIKNDKNIKGNIPGNMIPDTMHSLAKEPCHSISIHAHVKIHASCKDVPNGSITIETNDIAGGTAPYHIYYEGKKYNEPINLTHQKHGRYSFIFEDAMGCQSDTIISIEPRKCNRDFKFSPEWEDWKMPVFHDKKGSISIFTKFGGRVYQAPLNKNHSFTWQAQNQDGEALPMGTYTFIVEYIDDVTVYGTITIIR